MPQRARSIAGSIVTGAFMLLVSAASAAKSLTKLRDARHDGGDDRHPDVERRLDREDEA